MQETEEMQGWEDPLEEEMATHSSILAWVIPWTEEPGRLQSTGSQRVRHDWVIKNTHTCTEKLSFWHYLEMLLNIQGQKEIFISKNTRS